jgi:hypothetical protein
MKQATLFFLFLYIPFIIFAENKFTISGYVRDKNSGEELIGAVIYVKEMPTKGIATNTYGFYSLTIPEGTYTLIAQFTGSETQSIPLTLNKSQVIDFNLGAKITQVDEVIVTSERRNDNVSRPAMGIEKLNIQDIKSIPAFMGEKDVLKTIQLLPGIKSAGEGNSGFYVRGGTSDQNLILLDEATVYNASHLLGFFSIFNSDAIKDVTVYKGSIPAEYGGRLSSVLDINMNEGNNHEYKVNGGIGLISSRLTVEGPIVKDKGSFVISGRRTYADLITRGLANANIIKDSVLKTAALYFYDLNLKANYRISNNDRIYISGYFGRDILGIPNFGFEWGNTTTTIRWNHLYNNKLFSNTSVIYNDYSYTINNLFSGIQVNILSKIRDVTFKEDFQYYPSPDSKIKFGFVSTSHTMLPGTITTSNASIAANNIPSKHSLENALYLNHEYKINDYLSINYGVRFSQFLLLGPGTFNVYESNNSIDTVKQIIGSVTKGSNEIVKNFAIRPEPRVAISYMFNESNSVKISYNRNVQYLHLLSNSTTGSPTDMWIPSSINTAPEISDQIALGFFKNFDDNNYEFSTEIYYKDMQNQIDYIKGARLNANLDVESQLTNGIGRAYGIELFLKKKYGRFNGWIGYTLSRSERLFSEINNNTWYPAKQDRTHDVAVVGIYELSKNWTLSATWVYYTGNAVTFPAGKWAFSNDLSNILNNPQPTTRIQNYYTERNGYRMPAYHRLDAGATWTKKKTGKYESSWNFSVFNIYARENAYIITFGTSKTDPQKTVATQTSLFRFVPSVTYNFKF